MHRGYHLPVWRAAADSNRQPAAVLAAVLTEAPAARVCPTRIALAPGNWSRFYGPRLILTQEVHMPWGHPVAPLEARTGFEPAARWLETSCSPICATAPYSLLL